MAFLQATGTLESLGFQKIAQQVFPVQYVLPPLKGEKKKRGRKFELTQLKSARSVRYIHYKCSVAEVLVATPFFFFSQCDAHVMRIWQH